MRIALAAAVAATLLAAPVSAPYVYSYGVRPLPAPPVFSPPNSPIGSALDPLQNQVYENQPPIEYIPPATTYQPSYIPQQVDPLTGAVIAR